MGLSDEERRSGMYYAVSAMTELGHKIDEATEWKDETARLCKLLDSLWPALIGNSSNSCHWIMGSASSREIRGEPMSPWTMAIVSHLEKIDHRPQRSNGDDPSRDEEKDKKPFDAMDSLQIPDLIGYSDEYQAAVYAEVLRVYRWTEQIIYYLRRYKDDFLDSYRELSDTIARIQGECFLLFDRNDVFARAYLGHEICKLLYGPRYPYDDRPDVVTRLMTKHYVHHDLRKIAERPVEELAKYHVALVRETLAAQRRSPDRYNYMGDVALQKLRLTTVIELGNLAEYKHIRDSVLGTIRNSELADMAEAVEEKLAQQAAEIAAEKKERQDGCDSKRDESLLDCYSVWHGYELLDDRPKPEPEPEPEEPS